MTNELHMIPRTVRDMINGLGRTSSRAAKGFTLAEVLVTVAIIAVLAAVVVPAVTGQMDKGDLGRISNDIANLRTGVEQFVSDVRKYPGSIGQLTRSIATTDKDITATLYTSGYTSRWKGPYINKDYSTAAKTSFGVVLDTVFYRDTLTYGATLGLAVSLRAAAGSVDRLVIWHLDSLLDDGDTTKGVIRLENPTGGAATGKLKVLLVPIQ